MVAAKGSLQKLRERRIDELGRRAVLMIDGKQLYGECVVTALKVMSFAPSKHGLENEKCLEVEIRRTFS